MRKTFLVTRYVFYSVCTFLSSIQENSPSSQTVPSCDENQPKTTCEDLNIMLSYFIDSFFRVTDNQVAHNVSTGKRFTRYVINH